MRLKRLRVLDQFEPTNLCLMGPECRFKFVLYFHLGPQLIFSKQASRIFEFLEISLVITVFLSEYGPFPFFRSYL